MSYSETILSITGLNIILALSVYLTFAVGQFSLAQVGFWAIGAYVSAILTTLYGWSLLPALLVAAAVSGLIGVVLGYPCLRIRGIYLALATLGFSETVRVFFLNFEFQVAVDGIPVGPSGVLGFRNIVVLTTIDHIYIFVAILLAFFLWLGRSRLGLAFAAVREDDVAARFMGTNIVVMKVLAFALAAGMAAVGGGLYANYTSYITADDFGFHKTLLAVLFVALGGVETFYGPILAAVVLTLLPEYIRFLSEYRMMFYGILVVVIMVYRPRGLIDRRTVAAFERALHPFRRTGGGA